VLCCCVDVVAGLISRLHGFLSTCVLFHVIEVNWTRLHVLHVNCLCNEGQFIIILQTKSPRSHNGQHEHDFTHNTERGTRSHHPSTYHDPSTALNLPWRPGRLIALDEQTVGLGALGDRLGRVFAMAWFTFSQAHTAAVLMLTPHLQTGW